MKKPFTILIADRNRHVREFLRREMVVEGYRVRLAKNGREVIESLHTGEHLDMIILDLDQPDVNELSLVKKLADRTPTLPVVIHSHLYDYAHAFPTLSATALVEKDGQSVDKLKRVVSDILKVSGPQRSRPAEGGIPEPNHHSHE